MPGFDGRGPLGRGPMTGWGRGFCGYAGYGRGFGGFRGAGWANRFGGYGFGRGWGYGRFGAPGWWNEETFYPSRREEMEYLRNQASMLEEELHQIRQRLETLEKEDKEQ